MTGSEIIKIRERYNLSQRQLADALGVAIYTVCRWEQKNARLSSLALAAVHRFITRAERRRRGQCAQTTEIGF